MVDKQSNHKAGVVDTNKKDAKEEPKYSLEEAQRAIADQRAKQRESCSRAIQAILNQHQMALSATPVIVDGKIVARVGLVDAPQNNGG